MYTKCTKLAIVVLRVVYFPRYVIQCKQSIT